MSDWNNLIVTEAGQQLMSNVIAGKAQLNFTSIAIGSGDNSSIKNKVTSLGSPKSFASITSKSINKNTCILNTTFFNFDTIDGYYVSEMGIYASNGDKNDFLFAYATDNRPGFMPSLNTSYVVDYKIIIDISDISNITIVNPDNELTLQNLMNKISELKASVEANYYKKAEIDKFRVDDRAYLTNNFYNMSQINTKLENVGTDILRPNTSYKVGDIRYIKNLAEVRLECITAGTSASSEVSTSSAKIGSLLTYGSTRWLVDDVRDGSLPGDICFRYTLSPGYLKANGATVVASSYPRLLKYVLDNNLYVTSSTSDYSKYVYVSSSDRLTLPNFIGRVIQGDNSITSKEAGLPNITGTYNAHQITDDRAAPSCSGAFGYSTRSYTEAYDGSGSGGANITFDASKSNSIYGRSTTVQPPAICLIPQIKY